MASQASDCEDSLLCYKWPIPCLKGNLSHSATEMKIAGQTRGIGYESQTKTKRWLRHRLVGFKNNQGWVSVERRGKWNWLRKKTMSYRGKKEKWPARHMRLGSGKKPLQGDRDCWGRPAAESWGYWGACLVPRESRLHRGFGVGVGSSGERQGGWRRGRKTGLRGKHTSNCVLEDEWEQTSGKSTGNVSCLLV